MPLQDANPTPSFGGFGFNEVLYREAVVSQSVLANANMVDWG